jgi:hypothetical protein
MAEWKYSYTIHAAVALSPEVSPAVPVGQEAGLAPEPAMEKRKVFAPTGSRIPLFSR